MKLFPETDDLLMIHWIGGVTLPFGKTRSPAFEVLLRKLPFSQINRLNRMSQDEIRGWLRKPKTTTDQPRVDPTWTTASVLAGDLPLISVGDVYQQRHRIGRIPMESKIIHMTRDDLDIQPILEMETERPPEWTVPHYAINPSEYDLIKQQFPKSRYLIISDPTSPLDYIIPRTEIFRKLYGPFSLMSQEILSGPFHDIICHLVYTGDRLKSGLKTERLGDRCHLILQRNVPDPYARLIGLYYFDEKYAQVCGKTIFSSLLADAGNSNQFEKLHVAARIPYRADLQNPLTIRARGWWLGDLALAESYKRRKKFLVARLDSISEGFNAPDLWYQRVNANETSDNQVEIQQPKPYANAPIPHEASSNLILDPNVDANLEASAALMKEDEFFITNGKVIGTLHKDISGIYTGSGAKLSSPKDSIPDVASTGFTNHEATNPAPATVETVMRLGVHRFQHIRDILQDLVERHIISRAEAVSPENPWQILKCGGEDCWHFLSEDQCTIDPPPVWLTS